MKYFLLLLLSFSIYANEERVNRVINVINEEISEVDRLLRQFNQRNPDLQFRKAELILERARLKKELENEQYLALPVERRNPQRKKRIFEGSSKDFELAKRVASQLMAQNPNYPRADEAYYILGFNEKEQGREKSALSYFQKAETKAKPNSESQIRIHNALAELYYNKRDYKRAIYYYEKNLKMIKDKWWTKDAYNLSWSYYRIKNYEKAIRLMKRVNELSQKPQYVDMSHLGKQDIGLFYAESGKVREGLRYFKSQGRDFTLELLALGALLADQGKYPQALNAYNQALQYEKDPQNLVKLHLARIDLYDRYDKFNLHLKDSQKLTTPELRSAMTADQRQMYLFQVNKQVGKLQKRLTEKGYKDTQNLREYYAGMTNDFLNIAILIDPSKSVEYYFYQAETSFQARQYELATQQYVKSYDLADQENNQKIRKLSAEGILAALGQSPKAFPTQDKYLVDGYTRYLKVDSTSKQALEVYKRLYKYHLEKENTAGMEATLNGFVVAFPQNQTEQGQMLSSLVQLYSKAGKDERLLNLFKGIRSGQYNLSEKTKKDLNAIYQKFEIENIENLLKAGKIDQAREGYLVIWNDQSNDEITRANAAYNLMVISYKEYQTKETYDWGLKAVQLMDGKELRQLRDSFQGISRFLFERMQFSASADLAHRVFAKGCQLGGLVSDNLYRNASTGYRAANNTDRLKNLYDLSHRCKISLSVKNEALINLLYSYRDEKRYRDLSELLELVKDNRQIASELILHASYLSQYYEESARVSEQKKWSSYAIATYEQFEKNKAKGSELTTAALDALAILKSEQIQKIYAQYQKMQLKFPENVFNSTLERKINWLDRIQNEAIQLKDLGSGQGILLSFQYLVTAYSDLVWELKTFTPPGKSEDYVKSFKASMQQIILPLQQKIGEFESQGQDIINRNKIMATHDPELTPITGNHFHEFHLLQSHRSGGF